MAYRIYKITNLSDQKCYIGQTSQTIEKRWLEHQQDAAAGSELYLHRAIRKHGVSCFNVIQLTEVDSKPEADKQEKRFISQFQSYLSECGYNMTLGGEGGIPISAVRENIARKAALRRQSEPTRDRIGTAVSAYYSSLTEEERKDHTTPGRERMLVLQREGKIRTGARKGCVPWNKGLKGVSTTSEATRELQSKAQKERWAATPEAVRKEQGKAMHIGRYGHA